jgi:ferredoxin-type protein NapH
MPALREYKFLVLRRLSQVSIMLLFVAGNMLGWSLLRGNLSTSKVLDTVTLTDPYAMLQILASGHFVSGEALLGALIIVLFFGLIAGRAFCSWVCPINIVTDFAAWLRKMTGLDVFRKSPGISRKTRYWVIAASLAVSLATGIAAFEWISPISMLHRGIIFGMGMGWTLVLAVFFFDLFVQKDGFCGHICPLGGFYSLMTRFSLLRVRHNSEKCTLCMKCLEVCPEEQVLPMIGKTSIAVTSGECTNCGRCIEVCDDDAMKFGMRIYTVKS